MINFYYNPKYKYTNRSIIDVSDDNNYRPIEYVNIDSPDSINGHIIYVLSAGEKIPTYLVDTESGWRWFVSGITQLRTGKYQISLLRDLISENVELWKNENDCYISAGLATDYNKYKRWDLPFTNTKVNQQKLIINGKPSFFVYYVNEQNISSGTMTEKDLKISQAMMPGIVGYDYAVDNLNEIPYYEYVGAGNVNLWTDSKAEVRLYLNGGAVASYGQYYKYAYSYNNGSLIKTAGYTNENSNSITINTRVLDLDRTNYAPRNDLTTAIGNFTNNYQNSLGTTISQAEVETLNNYVNKYIFNRTDSKFYTIKSTIDTQIYNQDINNQDTGTLNSAIQSIAFDFTTAGSTANFSKRGSYYTFKSTKKIYNYTIEELGTATSYEFNFVSSIRKLPKSAVRCCNIVSSGTILDSDIAQALMLAQTNGINPDNTTGRILDIQYLPFSVATETNENIKFNGVSQVAQFLDNDDLQYITNLPKLTNIHKETDTIKIVSPSRASQFLFRPYDNNGIMIFNTKITLRPYDTTIYIRPSTQGLLIYDWDDKDCLVINEDFSLTNVSSEWAQYIYQNKNYSNIFDRQIQGREFERSWERQIENAQKLSDSWSARNLSATKARTYTGNIPIVSSIAGAIGSLFEDQGYMRAAQLDREYNEALYQEGLSLSRDLFNYQMDNIKSQPNIPSKITTIDCKFLDGVYLEYYSTNDTELNAIHNYYKYNGNRIDAYGSFAQYWGWYVRGKIIKSNYYTQPEIDELNRRLEMGVFTEVIYD